MNVKELCVKLNKTSWIPQESKGLFVNPRELDGILNLAWVLADRPKLSLEFLHETNTRAIWFMCCHLANEEIDHIKIGEYAMLLSPQALLGLMLDNENLFKTYLPISVWIKALRP